MPETNDTGAPTVEVVADKTSAAEVVRLTSMEYIVSGLMDVTYVRRTVEIAKDVADARLKSNRFVSEISDWRPYGMTVGGSASFVRDVIYVDFEGAKYKGWQAIEEMSSATLESRTY